MPLKGDAKSVMKSMQDQYGAKKGKEVFYATANKQNRTPETWKKKAAAFLHYTLKANELLKQGMQIMPAAPNTNLGDGARFQTNPTAIAAQQQAQVPKQMAAAAPAIPKPTIQPKTDAPVTGVQ